MWGVKPGVGAGGRPGRAPPKAACASPGWVGPCRGCDAALTRVSPGGCRGAATERAPSGRCVAPAGLGLAEAAGRRY